MQIEPALLILSINCTPPSPLSLPLRRPCTGSTRRGGIGLPPYGPVDTFLDGLELPDQRLVGTAFAIPHRVGAREDLDTKH